MLHNHGIAGTFNFFDENKARHQSVREISMKVRVASLCVALLAMGTLAAQAAPLSEILKKTPAGQSAAPVAAGGSVTTAAVAGAAAVAGGIAAAASNDETTSTTGTTGTVPQ